MKNLRATINRNVRIRSCLIKLVEFKSAYMVALFYTIKMFLEVTSLLVIAPVAFFLRCKFNKSANKSLYLFLVGKYIENLEIVNFDFYHLENKIKNNIFENFPSRNFVEFFFEDKSLKSFFYRHILLFSNTNIVVLASSWSPYAKSMSHPSKFYFFMVRWLSRDFKLIIIGWDSVSSGFWKRNVIDQKWVDVKVTENPNLIGLDTQVAYKCKIETILMPINIYNSSTLSIKNRQYDVFFSGKLSSYRDYRRPYIEAIKSLKINSFIHEIVNATDLLSYEDLYDALGNSKIGINFSKSVDQNEQLKGRAWETLLCGALLLEQENSQITNYFTPNVHFVFFSSPQDLTDKIFYYMKNPAELKKIAEAGNAKAISFQTSLRF